MKRISFFPTVHNRPVFPANVFENTFNDFFTHDFPVLAKGNGFHKSPAVNIAETGEAFRLEVAAPGLTKDDFEVKVDKEMLTISARKEQSGEEDGKYTRREFSFFEFKRTFIIPDTVDTDGIAANYENGILHVTMTKKAEAKPVPARTIEIA